MKVKRFNEFINESYTGPESVNFKKPYQLDSSWDNKNNFFVTINGNVMVFDARDDKWKEDGANDKIKKELKSFDLKVITKDKFGYEYIELTGEFEVINVKNNVYKLVRTIGNKELSFTVGNHALKSGNVQYSDDRPN